MKPRPFAAAAPLLPLDPLRYRSAVARGLLRLASTPPPLRWERRPKVALERSTARRLLDAGREE